MSTFYAHSKPGGDYQELIEHLGNTADLAGTFADKFGAKERGEWVGWIHDIGKCSDEVQKRICGIAYQNVRLDHSSAGAVEANKVGLGREAFVIGGHHSGLPNRGDPATSQPGDGTLVGKLTKQLYDYSAFRSEVKIPPAPPLPAWYRAATAKADAAAKMSDYFFVKMLFSCLTDADYLDTEKFMDGNVRNPSRTAMDVLIDRLEVCTSAFDKHRKRLDKLRTKIRKATVSHYADPKGIFTLTGPTGCGKTITSLDFALRHAREHGMDRVIYVIPYMSIISQTHANYSKQLGEENVLAHYSNAAWKTAEDQNEAKAKFCRMASENWDSPVVITTAVQFFESLYSASPARSRKLHNIVNSVVVFDEAQMLPIEFMDPCIAAMSKLVEDYGSSIVLCTATQPSLEPFFERFLSNGYKATELCPEQYYTDPIFKRNYIRYDGHVSKADLVERLMNEDQALCVVNTRQTAQELYAEMRLQKGVYHLSKSMTEADIAKTISTIRKRLEAKKRCVVISTCMIEAGVDVDFKRVYKEMAGLDSIVQAAGRCNREGKRKAKECVVHVFDTGDTPPQVIRLNRRVTCNVWFGKKPGWPDISAQEPVTEYFKRISQIKETDEKQIIDKASEQKFRDVSDDFHLIEGAQNTVIIPRKANLAQIEILRNGTPEEKAAAFRKLGKYSVGMYDKQLDSYKAIGVLEEVEEYEDIFILKNATYYSAKTGLLMDPSTRPSRGSY